MQQCPHDGAATYLEASDSITAVKSDRRLRNVDGLDTTAIDRRAADRIDRDALLVRSVRRGESSSRTTNPRGRGPAAALYDVAERWGTWHRVGLDGEPVYGVDLDRRIVLVGGVSDPCGPRGLGRLASDVLGLLGLLRCRDVGLRRPERVLRPAGPDRPRGVDRRVLRRPVRGGVAAGVIADAGPQPRAARHRLRPGHWGLLEQAAYGRTDVEIYEDSLLVTVPEPKDLRRLLRR